MEISNKQKAVALIQAVAAEDTDALSYLDPERFVQHDPEIADGVDGYRAWLQQPATVEVVRVLEDGDYVFAHSDYELDGQRFAGVDLFRFADGKVVEHWSNFQAFAAPNPSGHTLTDGETEVRDLDRTEANKSVIREFLNTHLVDGSTDVNQYFAGDDYVQHNPLIADGVSGLLAAGKAFREQGTIASFSAIHQILGEGNFVLGVSEGAVGDDPAAFFDLYRLEDGKIAEHWDVIQSIGSDAKNGNGKF